MIGVDVETAGSEPALSAAVPAAWLVKRYDLDGILLDTELSFVRPTIKSTCRTDMVPLYAAPPAPSVAVKALEWKRNGWVEAFAQPEGLGVWYSISPHKPVRGPGEPPFSCRVIWGVPNQTEGRYLGESFQSVEEAKATAQADYKARIRAALSAQVQDVAGWRSMDSAPKDGKHCLLAVKAGPFVYAVQGAYSMGEWGNAADIHSEPLCWMPLTRIPPVYLPWTAEFSAAAPAKQEGGNVTSQ